MRTVMMLLAAIAAACSVPSISRAQPFGIEEGTKRPSLNILKELGHGYFEVKPPRTHPEFEMYAVQMADGPGVCIVKAVGVSHQNDRYGNSVRSAFDEVRSQIEGTYGKSRLNNFLRPGALWKDTNEWVMSIHKNERAYQAVWGGLAGPAIKNNVNEILLDVVAQNQSEAYLVIQYRMSNFKACEDALRANDAKSF